MERTNFGHAATLILKATKISKQCLCEYCMKLKSLRYRQVKQGKKRWGKKKERKWNRKRERKELGLDRKERNLYNRKLIHVSFSSIINFLNVTKKKKCYGHFCGSIFAHSIPSTWSSIPHSQSLSKFNHFIKAHLKFQSLHVLGIFSTGNSYFCHFTQEEFLIQGFYMLIK